MENCKSEIAGNRQDKSQEKNNRMKNVFVVGVFLGRSSSTQWLCVKQS